jgi:hypothetical protein
MDREYARPGTARRKARDDSARDSRTGQRKKNLTTRRGPAVSGASKPAAAKRDSSGKRNVKKTGGAGKSAAGRKPRPAGGKSAAATRQALPRKPGRK